MFKINDKNKTDSFNQLHNKYQATKAAAIVATFKSVSTISSVWKCSQLHCNVGTRLF